MFQAQVADAWIRRQKQHSQLSYFHYVNKPPPPPQQKWTTSEDAGGGGTVAGEQQTGARSYPQLLRHYYHGPLKASTGWPELRLTTSK